MEDIGLQRMSARDSRHQEKNDSCKTTEEGVNEEKQQSTTYLNKDTGQPVQDNTQYEIKETIEKRRAANAPKDLNRMEGNVDQHEKGKASRYQENRNGKTTEEDGVEVENHTTNMNEKTGITARDKCENTESTEKRKEETLEDSQKALNAPKDIYHKEETLDQRESSKDSLHHDENCNGKTTDEAGAETKEQTGLNEEAALPIEGNNKDENMESTEKRNEKDFGGSRRATNAPEDLYRMEGNVDQHEKDNGNGKTTEEDGVESESKTTNLDEKMELTVRDNIQCKNTESTEKRKKETLKNNQTASDSPKNIKRKEELLDQRESAEESRREEENCNGKTTEEGGVATKRQTNLNKEPDLSVESNIQNTESTQMRNLEEMPLLPCENEDLKARFEKMAGEMMRHNNPDIVSLGDQHRATKIAERFNALYDEEWTTASYALTKEYDVTDEQASKYLLDILHDCHAFCEDKAETQLDALCTVLHNPMESAQHRPKETALSPRSSRKLQPVTHTALLGVRKEASIAATGQIKAAWLESLRDNKKFGTRFVCLIKPYLEKCAELCWAMVLNLPPLYMEFELETDTVVQDGIYTKCTRGDHVKQLVWPPLYNGKGGMLLAKGVVEAYKKAN